MKITYLLCPLFCLISLGMNGQLIDGFSDGDFTQNPAWEGDISNFSVMDGQLELQDSDPESDNTSILYTLAPTSLSSATQWSFTIKLGFNPSSRNFARVYVAAQSADLSSQQAAYFIQLGGAASNDQLALFRQDPDGNEEILIAGTTSALNASNTSTAVRLSRSTNGEWTLEADYTGADNYQEEGKAIDNTYDILRYFGFLCQYTSTRGDDFFFDDILVNPLYVDQDPPQLVKLEVLATDTILLQFDEALAANTAQMPSNYNINNNIGQPSTVHFDPEKAQEVSLILATPLENLNNYEISISNLSDEGGNSLETPILQSFQYLRIDEVAPGDLLISEFMANPNSVAGLPEAEYIELYNHSNKVLNLEGIGIASGGSPKFLSAYNLLPQSYLFLVNANNLENFQAFDNVMGIVSLPTLTNAGDEITLSLADGTSIQELFYNDSWYEDDSKSGGAFSLERIDFNQPVNCPGNWSATLDPRGGSPGEANSVLGQATETQAPVLSAVFPQGTSQVLLSFNEALGDLMSLSSIYSFEPNLEISKVRLSGQSNDQVIIELGSTIQEGTLYQVKVEQAEDCLGNFSDTEQVLSFAIPQPIQDGDLILNEVLFNPLVGGKDFIELVNVSDKVISLKGLAIINTLKGKEQIDFDYLMLPGQFVAITEEPSDLEAKYPIPAEANIIAGDLPTLEADEGNVTLLINNIVLDVFDYTDDLHSPLLDNERGVSLERLAFNLPTQSNSTWASGVAKTGFATPGYPNAQGIELLAGQEDIFTIENNTFSPDSDGFEDLLVLNYQVDRTGYLANIKVHDANGRFITNLSRNEALASQGIITWDGSNADGEKARIGIYVIWIELFTPDGDKQMEKLTCILAGRL